MPPTGKELLLLEQVRNTRERLAELQSTLVDPATARALFEKDIGATILKNETAFHAAITACTATDSAVIEDAIRKAVHAYRSAIAAEIVD